jgi:twitching motility protein PilT
MSSFNDPTDAPEPGLFSVPPSLMEPDPLSPPSLSLDLEFTAEEELEDPLAPPPPSEVEPGADDGLPIPPEMREILHLARHKDASDVHLTVGKPPAFRVNGQIEFLSRDPLTPHALQELIYGMLSPFQREGFHKRHQLCFSMEMEDVGFLRFNFYSQRGNPEAAIRLGRQSVPTFKELGVPPTMAELARMSGGLILVTGPTGVGKTSTLNAIIGRVNREERKKIITIEDPIEFIHPPGRSIVVQQEIGVDADSFEQAVTHALRQDPDIVVIGEMVDLETIAAALTAAETGHTVFGTLHTQGAAGTITRIIDVFPPRQQAQVRNQLVNTLRAVMSQKLLPRANHRGRMLVYELMVVNDAVRNLIRDEKIHQIANVMQTGRSQGMQLMDHMIRDAWMSGEITYETALGAVSDPKFLTRRRMT